MLALQIDAPSSVDSVNLYQCTRRVYNLLFYHLNLQTTSSLACLMRHISSSSSSLSPNMASRLSLLSDTSSRRENLIVGCLRRVGVELFGLGCRLSPYLGYLTYSSALTWLLWDGDIIIYAFFRPIIILWCGYRRSWQRRYQTLLLRCRCRLIPWFYSWTKGVPKACGDGQATGINSKECNNYCNLL